MTFESKSWKLTCWNSNEATVGIGRLSETQDEEGFFGGSQPHEYEVGGDHSRITDLATSGNGWSSELVWWWVVLLSIITRYLNSNARIFTSHGETWFKLYISYYCRPLADWMSILLLIYFWPSDFEDTEDCVDIYPEEECKKQAAIEGYCEDWRDFMEKRCKRACGFCRRKFALV